MNLNSNLLHNLSKSGLSNSDSVISSIISSMSGENNHSIIYGEVIDIILNDKHPDYIDETSLNVIKFRPISQKSSDEYNLPIAYPYSSSDINNPVLHEIVPIILLDKLFYLSPLNINNNIISNEVPDISKFKSKDDDETFIELGEEFNSDIIKNKRMFTKEGDKLISSRFGSFIYFSNHDNVPLTIISNDIIEDNDLKLNELTNAVIYSNNISIPFTPITEDKTFTSSKEFNKSYNKKQQSFFSGQFIFNAINGIIAFFSNKDIILNTNKNVVIDANNDVNINSENNNIISKKSTLVESKEITIGKNAEDAIVLGDKLVSILNDLITEISKLTVATGTGVSSPPTNISNFIKIQNKLKSILSKKTKVE